MISPLVDKIKEDSREISSEEIVQTIKFASWVLPTVASGLTAGALGTGITYALMKKDRLEQEQEASNKAILYGLAGALGGFGAGRSSVNSIPSMGLSPTGHYEDPTELSSEDMQYVFGRNK